MCKYVRKPHEAELLHHVVIVNEQGLLGWGFAGTFPFQFSDAHFLSVAIRYATEGEQAQDVPLGECPGREVPPPPPPEEPEVPEVPEVPEEPEIPEVPPAGVIEGPQGPAAAPPAADTRDAPDAVLPAAGAPATVARLVALGLALLAIGLGLLNRGSRRQSTAS